MRSNCNLEKNSRLWIINKAEINKRKYNNFITVMCELRTTGINAHTSLCSLCTHNMHTNVPKIITLHITENMFGQQIQVNPVERRHFVLCRTCIEATLLQLQWYLVGTNRCFSHGYTYTHIISRPIADIILQYSNYKKRAPNLNTYKSINYRKMLITHTGHFEIEPILNEFGSFEPSLNFTRKLKM